MKTLTPYQIGVLAAVFIAGATVGGIVYALTVKCECHDE